MSNDKYLAPPWIKYPTAPKESNFWKDGSGAEYLIKYNKNIEDKDEYEKIFPKTITFKDNITPSLKLNKNLIKYLESPSKPLFINLWKDDAKPKYNPEYVEDGYIMMYDTIFDNKNVIYIGTNHYHSLNEVITMVEDSIKELNLSNDEYEKLWDEIKYTVYLNSIYYKLVDDINLITEIIKTKDHVIACLSENLDYGVQKIDGKLVGNNLMGLAIMEIRDELIKSYENYDDIDWDLSGKPNSIKRCQCMAHQSNI